MPLYEYKCKKCSHLFSKLIWSPEDEKGLKCPECGHAKLDKQVSAPGSCGGCSSDSKPFTGYTRKYG